MIEHLAKCFKLQHFKEKAKLNDEIVTNYNLSKENYGMFIEAYKVENRLEVKKK